MVTRKRVADEMVADIVRFDSASHVFLRGENLVYGMATHGIGADYVRVWVNGVNENIHRSRIAWSVAPVKRLTCEGFAPEACPVHLTGIHESCQGGTFLITPTIEPTDLWLTVNGQEWHLENLRDHYLDEVAEGKVGAIAAYARRLISEQKGLCEGVDNSECSERESDPPTGDIHVVPHSPDIDRDGSESLPGTGEVGESNLAQAGELQSVLELDRDIESLAQQHIEAVNTVAAAERSAVMTAYLLGHRLIQRREQPDMKHGEWMRYLERMNIHYKTAQRAIDIATHLKPEDLGEITQSEALDMVKQLKRVPSGDARTAETVTDRAVSNPEPDSIEADGDEPVGDSEKEFPSEQRGDRDPLTGIGCPGIDSSPEPETQTEIHSPIDPALKTPIVLATCRLCRHREAKGASYGCGTKGESWRQPRETDWAIANGGCDRFKIIDSSNFPPAYLGRLAVQNAVMFWSLQTGRDMTLEQITEWCDRALVELGSRI